MLSKTSRHGIPFAVCHRSPLSGRKCRLFRVPLARKSNSQDFKVENAVQERTYFGQECIHNMKHVPSYLFLTGFISAFIVLGTTFLIPKLGARKFFILTIVGQIVMAMIVSHFGVLESPNIQKDYRSDPVILGCYRFYHLTLFAGSSG